MYFDESASIGVHTQRGSVKSPSIGLAPSVLPEARCGISTTGSHTGVSTNYARQTPKITPPESWFVLRATYGRERKAFDYLASHNIEVFLPTTVIVRKVGGKRYTIEESLIPNTLFAYGSEAQIKSFVYDNVNLPFLRFFYDTSKRDAHQRPLPLVVPDVQMRSFMIICRNRESNVLFEPSSVGKFVNGQDVLITDGAFKGVVGKVARYRGQQRVGVVIDGVLTAVTAYVPTAFIRRV